MTYELIIGDKSFSSWSLRGWLMFEKFGIPYRTTMAGLYTGTFKQDMTTLAPARFVPVLKTPDGIVIGDSLAMAETLAENHPDAGLWPSDPAARGFARWVTAEMHSGFAVLREDCTMYLRHAWSGFKPSPAVLADLDRIEELWAHAWDNFGGEGPWLFGDYCLADVFYAPIAMRIATYGLPVSEKAQAYVDAHLADPAIVDWREDGNAVTYEDTPYQMDLPPAPWPGPSKG